MAIETEKKYRLSTELREQVTGELRACAGEFIGKVFEENLIYSNTHLSEQGAVLRLRKTADRTTLTYKRRLPSSSDAKQQLEYETSIADGESMEAIIGELGFRLALVYEKYRETWKLRSTEVVLDELPFGSFLEIEGRITAIEEAEILLGIERIESLQDTYPRMTREFGKQVDGRFEARFDEREGK